MELPPCDMHACLSSSSSHGCRPRPVLVHPSVLPNLRPAFAQVDLESNLDLVVADRERGHPSVDSGREIEQAHHSQIVGTGKERLEVEIEEVLADCSNYLGHSDLPAQERGRVGSLTFLA